MSLLVEGDLRYLMSRKRGDGINFVPGTDPPPCTTTICEDQESERRRLGVKSGKAKPFLEARFIRSRSLKRKHSIWFKSDVVIASEVISSAFWNLVASITLPSAVSDAGVIGTDLVREMSIGLSNVSTSYVVILSYTFFTQFTSNIFTVTTRWVHSVVSIEFRVDGIRVRGVQFLMIYFIASEISRRRTF